MKSKVRNDFEAAINRQLKKAKVPFKYESEKIPYILSGHYTPDFIVETPLGKIYIEAKGYFRAEDKRKLVAVKKFHPEMDLRIVFYKENKKDIKWALKHHIKYSVGKVPQDWLKGL